jgi:hypothetical protein
MHRPRLFLIEQTTTHIEKQEKINTSISSNNHGAGKK